MGAAARVNRHAEGARRFGSRSRFRTSLSVRSVSGTVRALLVGRDDQRNPTCGPGQPLGSAHPHVPWPIGSTGVCSDRKTSGAGRAPCRRRARGGGRARGLPDRPDLSGLVGRGDRASRRRRRDLLPALGFPAVPPLRPGPGVGGGPAELPALSVASGAAHPPGLLAGRRGGAGAAPGQRGHVAPALDRVPDADGHLRPGLVPPRPEPDVESGHRGGVLRRPAVGDAARARPTVAARAHRAVAGTPGRGVNRRPPSAHARGRPRARQPALDLAAAVRAVVLLGDGVGECARGTRDGHGLVPVAAPGPRGRRPAGLLGGGGGSALHRGNAPGRSARPLALHRHPARHPGRAGGRDRRAGADPTGLRTGQRVQAAHGISASPLARDGLLRLVPLALRGPGDHLRGRRQAAVRW
jgi:hypothetical protein